jgi:hypothetical protein
VFALGGHWWGSGGEDGLREGRVHSRGEEFAIID